MAGPNDVSETMITRLVQLWQQFKPTDEAFTAEVEALLPRLLELPDELWDFFDALALRGNPGI